MTSVNETNAITAYKKRVVESLEKVNLYSLTVPSDTENLLIKKVDVLDIINRVIIPRKQVTLHGNKEKEYIRGNQGIITINRTN